MQMRLLFCCAMVALVGGRAEAQPAQVMIIRHAEKPPEGNELSLAGLARAAALAPYFLGTPETRQFGAPVAIYAQSPKKETSSLRPVQTVAPLANALNLPINQAYVREEYAAMAHEIMSSPAYRGRAVLICWEHKVIPALAAAFGVANVPDKWPGHSFDRTWVITFKAGAAPDFRDLPQKLMFGDSAR